MISNEKWTRVNASTSLTITCCKRGADAMAIRKGTRKPLTEAQREARRLYMIAYNKTHAEAHRASSTAWAQAHPEEKRAYNHAYSLANREKLRRDGRAYAAAHREEQRLKTAKWHRLHPEETWARNTRYRLTHLEEHRAAVVRWHATHPLACRANESAWRKRHPDVVAAKDARRRARKACAPVNDFTKAQWQVLQEAYNHRCVYCGNRAKGKLTRDHLTPLAHGGSHTLANILPACRSCNSRKREGAVLCPVQPALVL